jgi:hypothetical protein
LIKRPAASAVNRTWATVESEHNFNAANLH